MFQWQSNHTREPTADGHRYLDTKDGALLAIETHTTAHFGYPRIEEIKIGLCKMYLCIPHSFTNHAAAVILCVLFLRERSRGIP